MVLVLSSFGTGLAATVGAVFSRLCCASLSPTTAFCANSGVDTCFASSPGEFDCFSCSGAPFPAVSSCGGEEDVGFGLTGGTGGDFFPSPFCTVLSSSFDMDVDFGLVGGIGGSFFAPPPPSLSSPCGEDLLGLEAAEGGDGLAVTVRFG